MGGRPLTLDPSSVRSVRSHDLLDRLAEERPDEPGIGCDGRWMTYREWSERVAVLVRSLSGRPGPSPLALAFDAGDGIDFAVAYVAAHALRRPALVLNPRLPARDLQLQVDLAGAGDVLGSERVELEPARRPRPTPLVDQWGDVIADISFSSGTTGEPKGILLSHWGLAWSAVLLNGMAWAAQTTMDGPGQPLGQGDTLVSAFQAGSSATSIGFMNCGLLAGARLHWLSRFDGREFPATMASLGATAFYGGPAHLALWRQAHASAEAVARIYLLIGQAIPVADASWFLAGAGGAHLVNCFGLTESCAATMIAVDDELVDHVGAIGRPLDTVSVRITDDAGRDVDEGELRLHSFGMMEGYLDRPDLTAAKLQDGWLLTGDVVALEGETYCVRGRLGERINRGGYKFDPIEVEEVANAVDGVSGAVACGIPHDVLGEDVALAIEVREPHSLSAVHDAVVAALTAGLASFKVPRQVRAVRELPRAALGKPQRVVVAEWFKTAP